MALDRQTIEKRDFPIGRRGYEPEAVDAHLAAVAAQVEDLSRQSRSRSGASLASAASDQVRLIVQAAESSAAEIEQEARDEAARLRDEAAGDAERTRRDAVDKSQDHVGRVSEATSLMLQRVDAMESELSALMESLRTGANRLGADLSLLEGNMGELYSAAGVDDPPSAPTRAPVAAVPPTGSRTPVDHGDEPAADTDADEHAAIQPAQEQFDAAPEDSEGARLVALDMALSGRPREETDRYLAEHYDLSDRQGLLDEVYETAGG